VKTLLLSVVVKFVCR